MAVTVFPYTGESPDLTLLNVSRLFTRLEHNLLSPGAEVRALRKSEFQRMRVAKNVEYARTLLSQLERSLPQLKQLDRRHEARTEIARDRALLEQMQRLLEEEEARADIEKEVEEGDVDVDDEWEELFARPVEEKVVPSTETGTTGSTTQEDTMPQDVKGTTTTPAPTSTSTSTTITPTPIPTQAPSTLRNRHQKSHHAPDEHTAKTTGSSTKTSATEQSLSTNRSEQEDLTSSLLNLASQLKASSQSFQSTLENEKSVLDRAVSGIDKTTSTMEAAGQRMGMLRKMSEGKGWWGRMMLYAWIFGLWVVAILLVYVGPKMRF